MFTFLPSGVLGVPVAFLAGLASFFAPCVFPLLPAYISYIAGVSVGELKKGSKKYRDKLLYSSVFYVLGFSLIFVALGTGIGGLGYLLRLHARGLEIVGGLAMTIFGLEFSGFVKIPYLEREHKFKLPKWLDKLGYTKAFALGLIFAAAWTPCIGPIMGAILALAAVSATASSGAFLLFVYSLGISIPFLLVSVSAVLLPKYFKVMKEKIELISRLAGIMLILVGLSLVFGWYAQISQFVLHLL